MNGQLSSMWHQRVHSNPGTIWLAIEITSWFITNTQLTQQQAHFLWGVPQCHTNSATNMLKMQEKLRKLWKTLKNWNFKNTWPSLICPLHIHHSLAVDLSPGFASTAHFLVLPTSFLTSLNSMLIKHCLSPVKITGAPRMVLHGAANHLRNSLEHWTFKFEYEYQNHFN